MSWVLTMAHRRAVDRVRAETSASQREQKFARTRSPAPTTWLRRSRQAWKTGGAPLSVGLAEFQRESFGSHIRGHTYPQVAKLLGVAWARSTRIGRPDPDARLHGGELVRLQHDDLHTLTRCYAVDALPNETRRVRAALATAGPAPPRSAGCVRPRPGWPWPRGIAPGANAGPGARRGRRDPPAPADHREPPGPQRAPAIRSARSARRVRRSYGGAAPGSRGSRSGWRRRGSGGRDVRRQPARHPAAADCHRSQLTTARAHRHADRLGARRQRPAPGQRQDLGRRHGVGDHLARPGQAGRRHLGLPPLPTARSTSCGCSAGQRGQAIRPAHRSAHGRTVPVVASGYVHRYSLGVTVGPGPAGP